MTIKEMKKIALDLCGDGRKDDSYNSALVLLSAVEVGTTISKIVKFTGLSREVVVKIHRNLVSNNIFVKDMVCHSGWENKKTGTMAFLLDVCCGAGLIRRVKEK